MPLKTKPCESAAATTPAESQSTKPHVEASATPSATPHVDASVPAAQWNPIGNLDCKVRCPNPGCNQSTVGIPSKHRKGISTTTPFGKWLIKETNQFSIGSDQWCCTSCYNRMARIFNALPKHAVNNAAAVAPPPPPPPSNVTKPFASLIPGGTQARKISKDLAEHVLADAASVYPNDPIGALAAALQHKSIAPSLLNVLPSNDVNAHTMDNIKVAFKAAAAKDQRIQLLSLVANDLSKAASMFDFGCTANEWEAARLHARANGPGSAVKKMKFKRQRMSISQVKFITKFSVDREVVYRPASTATKDAQFKRRYSLRHGYQLLNERTEKHNTSGNLQDRLCSVGQWS
jgi:hypothetical protein